MQSKHSYLLVVVTAEISAEHLGTHAEVEKLGLPDSLVCRWSVLLVLLLKNQSLHPAQN